MKEISKFDKEISNVPSGMEKYTDFIKKRVTIESIQFVNFGVD